MTTETTTGPSQGGADPLEQAVMEEANAYAASVIGAMRRAVGVSTPDEMQMPEADERLRLHVQLVLAKARSAALNEIRVEVDSEQYGRIRMPDVVQWAKVLGKTEREIAALEARLQEEMK